MSFLKHNILVTEWQIPYNLTDNYFQTGWQWLLTDSIAITVILTGIFHLHCCVEILFLHISYKRIILVLLCKSTVCIIYVISVLFSHGLVLCTGMKSTDQHCTYGVGKHMIPLALTILQEYLARLFLWQELSNHNGNIMGIFDQ